MQVRVNAAFIGFFNNRLMMASCVGIVMLVSFFVASSFTEHSSRASRAKQVNLIIRQIGDRLLLQSGDSTSRILPVTETKEGMFLLRFENEFAFNHDSLMVLSKGLLPKTQFPSGYTVTVHDCIKGDIIFGFQLNNTSPDILACKGRSQPAGCYTIEFDFPDFYESVKQRMAGTDQQTESVNINSREANPTSEEVKTTSSGYDISQQTEALTPINTTSKEGNTKFEKIKTTIFGYPLINIVYGGILVFFCVILLTRRFGNLKPVSMQHPIQAVIKEPVTDLPVLGKFLFDEKSQRLLLGTEVIGLTGKECQVLELLHKNFGELIPRETLMQEVWINEGVITGRSLDMFISKLRKKLSADPDLRITNVHGKGYRLETISDPIG